MKCVVFFIRLSALSGFCNINAGSLELWLDDVSPTEVSPNEKSRTFRPLDRASLGRCVPGTMCPLDGVSLGRCVPCNMRPLDDVSLDDASLGHGVPGRCVLTLERIDVLVVISYFGLGCVAYDIKVFVFSSFAKTYVFSFCPVWFLRKKPESSELVSPIFHFTVYSLPLRCKAQL